MPLSEIAGLAATLDGEGHSEVADAAAARWGYLPGTARFWRSSASHVFVLPTPDQPSGRAFLRFVPETWRPLPRVRIIARLAARLAEHGRPVAAPLSSVDGHVAEAVATPRGVVHATLIAGAPGTSVDLPDLTTGQASAWGAALADLHAASEQLTDLGAELPEAFEELDAAAAVLAPDPELIPAVARLRDALAGLPRDRASFGVGHGDFELDNLAWTGDTPTAYDFDDATRTWFVADIASALRDLSSVDSPPGRAFVEGYRTVRELPASALATLPLFAAAQAATWLVRLRAIVDCAASPGDPPWLVTLRARLDQHRLRQRAIVLG